MNRIKRSRLLATLLFTTIGAPLSFATHENLNLDGGTMTLGTSFSGSASGAMVTYSTPDMRTTGNFSLAGNLDFGYFVVDNFMVDFRVNSFFPIGKSEVASRLGLGFGLNYYFDTSSFIAPYVGAGAGTSWSFTANSSRAAWATDVNANLGMLAGINTNVALDFGVRTKLNFPLGQTGGPTQWSADLGYVGVRAFF